MWRLFFLFVCYLQDAAKRQTAGIVFTHRPKIRFFAPQGRHVAPIQVNILPVCIVLRGTMLLFLVTGRMPRSGKLPVLFLLFFLLFLLTGQKSGFSPRRGDSLQRFRSDSAVPTGTWVRLAVQRFTSIAPGGWECGPQNIKNFHFFCK